MVKNNNVVLNEEPWGIEPAVSDETNQYELHHLIELERLDLLSEVELVLDALEEHLDGVASADDVTQSLQAASTRFSNFVWKIIREAAYASQEGRVA